MKNILRKVVLAVCAALVFAGNASAVIGSAQSATSEMKNSLISIKEDVFTIVSFAIGFISIAMIAWGALKYFKSDGNTNDSLIKIGAGILIIVVLFNVAKMVFF